MVLILLILLISPFVVAFISGEIQNNRIRRDVFEYVAEYKDSIELSDPERYQYFEYYELSFVDAGIIYGYFYSPNDEIQNQATDYRNGYLRYGTPYSGRDWCYFERICDNRYYYEEHYG